MRRFDITFLNHHPGFEVYFRDTGRTVPVLLSKSGTFLTVDGPDFASNCSSPYFVPVHTRYRLSAFRPMFNTVVEKLVANWKPKNDNTKWGRKPPRGKMHIWIQRKVAENMRPAMLKSWRDLLKMAPEWAVKLDNRLFSVCVGKEAPILLVSIPNEVKHMEQLLKDIQKFRGAAIAFDQARHLFNIGSHLRYGNEETLDVYPEAGLNEEEISPLQALKQLDKDWKRFFAPGFAPYTTLNKTLAVLPGRIPPRLLLKLKYVKLQRPIYRRSELITAILGSLDNDTSFDGHYAGFAGLNAKVFQFANHEQIKKAVGMLGDRVFHTKSNSTSFKEISQLVNYLGEYGVLHRGNLIGLTRKAIKWHTDRARQRVIAFSKHPPETKTKKPPLEPPAKIHLLETVGDVQQEGINMCHCIGGYANGAVDGKHYLFHIKYKGELASAQVSFLGKVLQCFGPHNKKNEASKWGEMQLGIWGRKLKTILTD